MRMLTTRFCSTPQILLFLVFTFSIFGTNNALQAEENVHFVSSPKTRTIVAEFIMMDGGLFIVRGERGEIQIEVTPDTKISEKFTFGDRIKAVLLPNDVAQSITRATPDEPFGIISTQESEPPPPAPGSTSTETTQNTESSSEPVPPPYEIPKVRVIIADLLMIDGNFYIVRTEHGEIQIEITADTERSEEFKFGDTIKARITPSDVALSVIRASKDDRKGFQDEIAPSSIPSKALTPVPPPSSPSPTLSEKNIPEPEVETTPSFRTIVADVLMVDGDFYIVRGEKGEIRIEVTPKTVVSESFNYGDRIKTKVLPDDKALTIERANPKDPVGITTQ